MGRNSASLSGSTRVCRSTRALKGKFMFLDLLQALDAAAQSRSLAGTGLSMQVAATFARMRSLLIMIGEERISRTYRPMLNSLSLRYPVNPLACSALMTVEIANSEALTLSRFMDA